MAKVPVYERHPLSAEYEDISGEAWLRFSDGVKEAYNGRPVILYQGKVLDGWQLYRACVLHGIKPGFYDFDGNEMEAERFVEQNNDNRRHIPLDKQQQYANERRNRVAKLRASGMSVRAIAKKTGASRTTTQRDLETLDGPGGTPDPPEVIGEDGKPYKPRGKRKSGGGGGKRKSGKGPKPPKLCRRCKRVGAPSCDDCRRKALEYKEAVESLKPPPQTGSLDFEGARFDRMRQSLKDLREEADAQLAESKEHASAERNKFVAESFNLETLANTWQNRLKRKKEGQRHA